MSLKDPDGITSAYDKKVRSRNNRYLKHLLEVRKKSVFLKVPPEVTDTARGMMYFHRVTVILYLMYSIWGLFTIFSFVPALAAIPHGFIQLFLGVGIVMTAIPAAVGAGWFYHTARLELFAGSAFLGLVIIYLGYLGFYVAWEGISFGNYVINCSYIAVPIARTIYIYRTMVKRAAGI